MPRGRHHPQLFGGLQPPEDEISSCVLYFFNECLIYSGAIFSVKRHIKTYCRNARKEISFCICFRVRSACSVSPAGNSDDALRNVLYWLDSSQESRWGKCQCLNSQDRRFCELFFCGLFDD